MDKQHTKKGTILVVDDCENNRDVLSGMLSEEYDIVEASNGDEALNVLYNRGEDISLVLLDIVMPEADGFKVLERMGLVGWIEHTPVIMISSETSNACVRKAYANGATDFITRPFDCDVVKKRVSNTMTLYAKQHHLEKMVAEQIEKRERGNQLMIALLSQIVETRNKESGSHVFNVRTITKMLLRRVNAKMDNIFSEEEISLICTASSLHDIGKIDVPEKILNKKGSLTPSEMDVMRQHSRTGANIIDDIRKHYPDEPLLNIAHKICLWHHERFDGNGYPDRKVGNSVPVYVQAVALADAYDALTSDRSYKGAYDHETAVQMIKNGECGVFNPILLSCMDEIDSTLLEICKAKASE